MVQIPYSTMMMFGSQRCCSSSLAGDLLTGTPGWQVPCPDIAVGCVTGQVTRDEKLVSTSRSAEYFLLSCSERPIQLPELACVLVWAGEGASSPYPS